jgi:membrane-bound ClpP family serine protease
MSALGLALVIIGAALAATEAHVVSHGALGSLAVVALAAGLALTVAGAGGSVAAALVVGLAVGIVGAAFGALVLRRVLEARRAPVRGGAAGLLGHQGEVRRVPAPVGRVFVDGALWRARAWSPEAAAQLHDGDPVVVERVDGLTLTVRPAEEWEVAP